MATIDYDPVAGLSIGLEHSETQKLLATLGVGGGGALVGTLVKLVISWGVEISAAGYIGAAIAVHVLWESIAIAASDKGDGVYLQVPPGVLAMAPGVIIPYTRTPPGVFDGRKSNGSMNSGLSDTIDWTITRGDSAAGTVSMKLYVTAPSGWAKELRCLGESGGAVLHAEPGKPGQHSFPSTDLPTLTGVFWKPQFLGSWGPAELEVSNWAGVNDRDTATFAWVKDT